MKTAICALCLLAAACDERVRLSVASQEVTGWTTDQVVVYVAGGPGAPTEDDLSPYLVSPPAGSGQPTAGDMSAVAWAVYDRLPASDIDESARPRGGMGCVVDWNQWTCWVSSGGRTYYCSGATDWISCGSFSGGWR